MSVLRTLKGIARKFRPPHREPQFQPQYGARRLIDSIRLPGGAAAEPLMRSIAQSRRIGSFDDCLPGLVRYFHDGWAPRFFYDARALIGDPSARGHDVRRWLQAACSGVREWTENGLPVYHLNAPALVPGFPWGGEWWQEREDVLYPVRPHRFAFAPRFALAVASGIYPGARFAALLSDWMRFATRSPALPFISNLVVTQRLIASACAFHFLRACEESDAAAVETAGLLLQIMAEDVEFLVPRIGDSYPNNHLLIDRFAAWLIAALLPEFSAGRLDCAKAEEAWLAELERQTYADGGSFEHSVHYHGLVTEAAAAWLLIKRAEGRAVSGHHFERVERMLRLQADLAGPDGHAPAIGNGTEDPLFPLDGGDGTTSGALREIYRALFASGRPALNRRHPELERAFWLLGGRIATPAAAGEPVCSSHYEQGGLHVFFDHGESTRCVFRTGPVAGTSTAAGHMHADPMSVYWVHRGTPVLVDCGTWSYRFRASHAALPDVRLREHLCGPQAHNGVVVDGVDPLGPMKGDFRSGPAQIQVAHDAIATGKRIAVVQARMTAPEPYTGFARGVVHVSGMYFLVYSRLPEDVQGRDVHFPLHFAPEIRVARQACVLALSMNEGTAADMVWSQTGGMSDAASGWVSPHYGELASAPRFRFRPAAGEPVSAFVLNAEPAAGIVGLEAIRVPQDAVAFKLSGADFYDYMIVNPGGGRVEIDACGLEFEGLLLWLRIPRCGRAEVRSLGTKRLRVPEAGIDLRFPAAQSETCLAAN